MTTVIQYLVARGGQGMTLRSNLRDALGQSVTDLEATVACPAIIREAEVWSEREAKEVDAVCDQINLLVGQRNLAVRADLLNPAPRVDPRTGETYVNERVSDAVARLQGKKVEPRAVDEPSGGRWDAQRAEAERLAAKDITLDPLNYEDMKRELERREVEDAEALDQALREANK